MQKWRTRVELGMRRTHGNEICLRRSIANRQKTMGFFALSIDTDMTVRVTYYILHRLHCDRVETLCPEEVKEIEIGG